METIELLDPGSVQAEWAQATDARPQIRMLEQASSARGYVPLETDDAIVGVRYRAQASGEVIAPRVFGETASVQQVEFEVRIRSLTMPGTANQAAIATATISAGENSSTYEAFLEARDGNFNQITEYTITGNRLTQAESWWSAVVRCLSGSCATVCLGALVSCTGAWAAYLLCVLAACGGCGAKCTACATCDCRWWCRWATGCCDQ
jgi:hypothetical protein